MDLKTAIIRAARFARKPKDKEPTSELSFLRFLPPMDATDRARVFATNGLTSVLLTLDEGVEVQNACAPAEVCEAMAKECDFIAQMNWSGKGLEFIARRKKGTDTYRYRVPAGSIANFPSFQTPPEPMQYVPRWDAIAAVVHAAGDHKIDNDLLRCVRFSPKAVEATDRYRLARADVDMNWSGLVPNELFSHWPRGDVFARFTALYAFFRIGDELRYSNLLHGKYADIRSVLADEHRGHVALCPTEPLLKAVKQAVKMHKARIVGMEFKGDTVKVLNWTHRDDQQFHTTMPAEGATDATVLVLGPHFYEALGTIKTPRVFVGYGPGEKDLVRLESGTLTVCLWPMLEPPKEVAHGQSKG